MAFVARSQWTHALLLLVAIQADALGASEAGGGSRCAECREHVEYMIEREARKLSKMYAQPCAEQGYQACRRVAEERYRRSSAELGDSDWDCSKSCAAESGANSGPDYAAIADCRGQVQDEVNRLTSERQKCYGAVIGNPANVFSCKEIDSRIDLLKRQRDNCDMNPEQGMLSARKSRQTDSNILPPTRSGTGSGRSTPSGSASDEQPSASTPSSNSSNASRGSAGASGARQRYPTSDLRHCIRLVNESQSSFIQNDCNEKLLVTFTPTSGYGAGMEGTTAVGPGGRSSTNRTSGITGVGVCRYPDFMNSEAGYCTVAGR